MSNIKKHKRNFGPEWGLCSLSQKRHKIFAVTSVSSLMFWRVCGKEKQRYYNELPMNELNIDSIRDEIYHLYVDALENSDVFNKEFKIKKIKEILYNNCDSKN